MKNIFFLLFVLAISCQAQTSKTVTPTWVRSLVRDSILTERTARAVADTQKLNKDFSSLTYDGNPEDADVIVFQYEDDPALRKTTFDDIPVQTSVTTILDSLVDDIADLVSGVSTATYSTNSDNLFDSRLGMYKGGDEYLSQTTTDQQYIVSDIVMTGELAVNNLVSNVIDSLFETTDSLDVEINKLKIFTFQKTSPDSGATYTLLRTKSAITIDSVFTLVRTTGDSVEFNIHQGTDRSVESTIWANDELVTNTTVGQTITDIDDATIPINNMLWIEIVDTFSSPTEFLCVIYYH